MSLLYKRAKGFADIHDSWADLFSLMENEARNIFSRYGFQELRTPLLETTDLFQRSIGSETDVVQKEMFTFPDRKGRSLTLRPEATAGVLRACLEEGLLKPGQITRLFTIGPMFRYERPQKGRMRQFHQINCECLGTASPFADAEVICMLLAFLRELGLNKLVLRLNSLGCRECRPLYLEKLRQYLAAIPEKELCVDCARRRTANPLRVLDCKEPACKAHLEKAPVLLKHNCPSCRGHFEQTLSLLDQQGVAWELDNRLVRGLDYYQRTTFEVVSDEIGAQTAVAGGGRYDGLIAQLGGDDVPGIGFACGMERLALLLEEPEKKPLDFYFVPLSDGFLARSFDLTEQLRRGGCSGEMNYAGQSFKAAMRQANRLGALFVIILGADEAAREEVLLKDMACGEQRSVPQKDLLKALREGLAGLKGRN